jgi:hypothetical protein
VLDAIANVVEMERSVNEYICSMIEPLFEIDPLSNEKSRQLLKAQDELLAATAYLDTVVDDLKNGIRREEFVV